MRYGFVLLGIVSAALFGVATPLSKILLRGLSQFQLAGLLYLGAGIAMLPFVTARCRAPLRVRLNAKNAMRLAVAVLAGGCVGPVLLLLGLASARASSVSLWLNLELAATALLGFLLFHDHLDTSGWFGVGGALLAGVLVTAGEGSAGIVPSLLVAGACVCWGLDNSLTALIDSLTPQETTFFKGLIAGSLNSAIGMLVVKSLPAGGLILAALSLGAVCYGGSIALFIAAAQRIGAARAQVLFASGPFFGMLMAVVALGERLTWMQGAAILVLLGSIALMLRARHAHHHQHEPLAHIHSHRHDDLHHAHDHSGVSSSPIHSHEHGHEVVAHDHAHVPDLHHRHAHEIQRK
ncbi:MAG: multidrug DMT transporter permease [Deltaproteobacteria bacterium RBG_13_65_10]|nr:MAG: multidrug DMT transporter permease [Deltaproteobacteria bacterium RBG_13_65_10]